MKFVISLCPRICGYHFSRKATSAPSHFVRQGMHRDRAVVKAKGQPIPTNDLWIAASSLRHGLAVATFDEHFKAIEGLLVVN